jgi:hypothetical protein
MRYEMRNVPRFLEADRPQGTLVEILVVVRLATGRNRTALNLDI